MVKCGCAGGQHHEPTWTEGGRKGGREGEKEGEREGVRTGEKGEGRCHGWEHKDGKERERKEPISIRFIIQLTSFRTFSSLLPYTTRHYG